MVWQKGQSGNPVGYKSKTAGRRSALALIDKILAEAPHLDAFEAEMRKYIGDHGVMAFYERFGLPLVPKSAVLSGLASGGTSEDGDENTFTLRFEIATPEDAANSLAGVPEPGSDSEPPVKSRRKKK